MLYPAMPETSAPATPPATATADRLFIPPPCLGLQVHATEDRVSIRPRGAVRYENFSGSAGRRMRALWRRLDLCPSASPAHARPLRTLRLPAPQRPGECWRAGWGLLGAPATAVRTPPQSSPLLRSATVCGTRASAARASPRYRLDPVGHRHSYGRPSHPSRSLPLGECLVGTRWCSSLHDDGLGPRRACLDGSSIGANHAREQCNHHRSRDYRRRSLVHLRRLLRLDCQQPYGRADRERATAE